MKKLLFIASFTLTFNSFSQGLYFGFGSGVEGLRLEAGYSLNDNLHIGARFAPGFNLIGIPSYYAGAVRYTFEDNDFGPGFLNASFRGYLGASLGLIRLKGDYIYDIYGNQSTESRSQIGLSADAGAEFLYGKRGRFGSFFELNLGQVPSYFNTLNNIVTIYGQEAEPIKLAAFWGFSAGIRIYFVR